MAEKADAPVEEMPPAPEPSEEASARETAAHEAAAEPESDTSGDFREPHPEESGESMPPEEISASHLEPVAETGAELPPEPPRAREPEPSRAPARHQERPPHGHGYAEPRRPEPRQWSKPADFRPAESSAISQAVAHATEIAESLKQMIDGLDEILELVEIAERQKLADEREIDELRRALRRIQPPRHQQQHHQRGPRHEDSHRGQREHHPRHEEHAPRQEPPENSHHEELRPPESGESPHTD